MQKGMEIKKNKHFEHIRAFSVLAVITIHTMYSALLQFGEGALVAEKILYRCVMNMMWWAVPCFLMMTGSLLLDSNRKVPLKKLYRKYILRMLLVLLIFGGAFSWMELFFDSRILELRQILQVAYNVLTGNTWAHMWYIYCLLGLYVLLPMYKIFADYASDEQLKYILAILFLFESIFRLLKLLEINARSQELLTCLCQVWESSVRATHHFLSEEDIRSLAVYVPQALAQVPVLVVAFSDQGIPVGFMGIDGTRLEMLFLSPDVRGTGLGRQLLQRGIRRYGVTSLCVNEQNPQALDFYLHMGFQVRSRTETDEQGNPFPLLCMSLPG